MSNILEMLNNKTAANDQQSFEFLFKIIRIAVDKAIFEASDRTEPVIRYRDPKYLNEIFVDGFRIDNHSCPEDRLIELVNDVIKFTMKTAHPYFFNQFSAGLDLHALAGIWLSDILNGNMFTYECAPVFTLMEKTVIRDVATLFGYLPDQSQGIFLPGASLANGCAINIARYHKLPQIKTNGMYECDRMIILTSKYGHYSTFKMASFLGFGESSVIPVNTTATGQMDMNHLKQLIHQYQQSPPCACSSNANVTSNQNDKSVPLIVIATAGSTVLGSFDPLNEIADICQRHNIWMHVDAAWGGVAIFSDNYKHNLDGIEKSNSFCWCPQKAFGIPQQCSIMMVRDSHLLQSSHHYDGDASYLFQSDKCYDSVYDLGQQYLQCGRKPDVFKFWLMWKAKGHDGLKKHISELCDRAEYITSRIEDDPLFELVCKPSFLNVCFWCLPGNLHNKSKMKNFNEIKQLTIGIKDGMMRRGSAMISNQSLPDNNLPEFFRFVCCNSSITREDCDHLLHEIKMQSTRILNYKTSNNNV